jgi:hypothetical protein
MAILPAQRLHSAVSHGLQGAGPLATESVAPHLVGARLFHTEWHNGHASDRHLFLLQLPEEPHYIDAGGIDRALPWEFLGGEQIRSCYFLSPDARRFLATTLQVRQDDQTSRGHRFADGLNIGIALIGGGTVRSPLLRAVTGFHGSTDVLVGNFRHVPEAVASRILTIPLVAFFE